MWKKITFWKHIILSSTEFKNEAPEPIILLVGVGMRHGFRRNRLLLWTYTKLVIQNIRNGFMNLNDDSVLSKNILADQ